MRSCSRLKLTKKFPGKTGLAALYGWDTRVSSPSLRYRLFVQSAATAKVQLAQGKTCSHTPTLDIEESDDDVGPEVQILKHVCHNKDFYKPGTSKKAKL